MQGATDVDVKLVYFKPDGTQKDISIREGRYIVGRTDEAQLRIPLATVSRKHCELVVQDEKLVIRDLGSANGTYLNYERVQNAELGAGDVVGIGPCLLTVQINGLPSSIEPPSDSSGESSLMETPPAGLDTEPDADSPLDNVSVDELSESDPDETVTRSTMGSVLPNAATDDSSIFDFDFDFEDDENPQL